MLGWLTILVKIIVTVEMNESVAKSTNIVKIFLGSHVGMTKSVAKFTNLVKTALHTCIPFL